MRAAARCGPITTPNHKLIPDVRWILNLPEHRVVARSDLPNAAKVGTRGSRSSRATAPCCCARDSTRPTTSPQDTVFNLPPAGYDWIAATPYYAAYARCPN